jgi:putative glutamine amidotransferase
MNPIPIHKKKPLIGISGMPIDLDLRTFACIPQSYSFAVETCGGTVLLMPPGFSDDTVDFWLALIDGLLMTGGKDVDPSSYGEETLPACGLTDIERDRHDIDIITKALEKDIPVLGICRGSQILNVALGGTLYQDIISQVEGVLPHVQWDTLEIQQSTVHRAKLVPTTRLRTIIGHDDIGVNSGHHCAVKVLNPYAVISAQASDGVIEAWEVPGKYFCMGIQWHPEQLIKQEEHKRIFEAFIDAAKSKTCL